MINYRKVAQRAVHYGAQQKTRELAEFLELLDTVLVPRVIVEIGCAEGATLWAWQQVAPTVIGVDDGDYTITAPTDAPIISGDSHKPGTYEDLVDLLGGVPVDCLFIDGDHSYLGVHADHDMYRGLVRPGGWIALHDIVSVSHDPGYELSVPKFWAEIRTDTAIEIVDDSRGSGGKWGDEWGGIGVITT